MKFRMVHILNILPSVNSRVMNKMAELARSINSSSVSMTLGEGVFGILMKQTDPQDVMEVSFAIVAKRNKIYVGVFFLI